MPRSLPPDHRNTILFPGFQAPGTRGDSLVKGAREVKIHGSYVPVDAEVVQLDGFSAHADQAGLLGWLQASRRAPSLVFVAHGEPAPADNLRRKIEEVIGCDAHVPSYEEQIDLA